MPKGVTLIGLALTTIAIGGCTPTDTRCPAPGVIFASIDLDCKGGGKFGLSTGTLSGTCQVVVDTSLNSTGATCTDDKGNKASASCSQNGGKGTCGSTSGAGSCTSK